MVNVSNFKISDQKKSNQVKATRISSGLKKFPVKKSADFLW